MALSKKTENIISVFVLIALIVGGYFIYNYIESLPSDKPPLSMTDLVQDYGSYGETKRPGETNKNFSLSFIDSTTFSTHMKLDDDSCGLIGTYAFKPDSSLYTLVLDFDDCLSKNGSLKNLDSAVLAFSGVGRRRTVGDSQKRPWMFENDSLRISVFIDWNISTKEVAWP